MLGFGRTIKQLVRSLIIPPTSMAPTSDVQEIRVLTKSLPIVAAELFASINKVVDRIDEISKKLKPSPKTELFPLGVGEKIRIAFLFQVPSILPSWHSFLQVCRSDKRFKTLVVLTPQVHPDRGLSYLDEAKATLISCGIEFFNANAFSLESFRPHVVVLQLPYPQYLPHHLRLQQIEEFGSKIVYIPYGLDMGGGGYNYKFQFNLPVQQSAWKIFVRSERHKAMFAKYCSVGSGHVIVTGHPKLDYISQPPQEIDDAELRSAIAVAEW